MRIGVVCEGPTDYYAIERFFRAALEDADIDPTFIPIQPQIDNTQPDAGWANVLLWLNKNPPQSRIQKYFAGGLFGGPLATDPLNGILIHLDSDILGEISFTSYIESTFAFTPSSPPEPDQRASEIRKVIQAAAKFDMMTDGDRHRHVVAPAVESTEAWCVAAFTMPVVNTEFLAGQNLTNAFMNALEQSEGRVPSVAYAKINKDPIRRKQFCKKHANGWNRIIQGCPQFRTALDQMIALAS